MGIQGSWSCDEPVSLRYLHVARNSLFTGFSRHSNAWQKWMNVFALKKIKGRKEIDEVCATVGSQL